jgi:tetratricopeptide (TPR) repeat protein
MYDLFQGRHEEARRRLRRAVDLDPNSAFARGYLGVCYAFAGDYEAAVPILQEAIRLSPRDPLLVIWHLCKGWAALLSGRYQEAIQFTSEAVEANTEFPDVHAVLAAAHGHLGNTLAAGEALAGFLRRTPALTATDERLNRPFGTAAQRECFLEGLRKAGLPQG